MKSKGIIFLIFLALVFSCTKKKEGAAKIEKSAEASPSANVTHDKKNKISIEDILSYYPQKPISRKGAFELVFNQSVGEEDRSAERVVSLRPSMAAEIRWISDTVVRVEPKELLPPGQKYNLHINLRNLKKDLYDHEEIDFDLFVRKPGAEIQVVDLEFENDKLVLPGTLELADYVDSITIEKMLVAKQDGRKLNVHWEHSLDGQSAKFRVQQIKRGEFPSSVSLNWALTQIGLEQDVEKQIPVEPFKDFLVSGIRAEDSSNRSLIVVFNDPLDAQQDISSKIRLTNAKFSTEIDGNRLKIYLKDKAPDSFKLEIKAGIRSSAGLNLKTNIEKQFELRGEKPGVRFVGQSTIMPDGSNLSIPFEAVNVHSVQVTAFKVYESKIDQFLQINGFSHDSELGRVGRYLWRKTVALDTKGSGVKKWKRFYIDASELVEQNRNSLYRLELSINRGNSTYPCQEVTTDFAKEKPYKNIEQDGEYEQSNWSYVQSFYTSGTSRWLQRKDPCKDPYYLYNDDGRTVSKKNLIRTNLGLIVQRSSGLEYLTTVTDIKTAQPVSGVGLEFLNYQGQLIHAGATDDNGFYKFAADSPIFIVKAATGKDRSFLRLARGRALSMSQFDVGGEKVERGVKGRLYFERGVWRPGDKIHAVFSLHDPEQLIPKSHPLHIELFDPKGRKVISRKPDRRLEGLSYFELRTDEKAMTGRYMATVRMGDRKFSSPISIETVKPNRLKVELNFENQELQAGSQRADLFSQWLHGASASGLKAKIEMTYSERNPKFTQYSDFNFSDRVRQLRSKKIDVFKGALNQQGRTRFSIKLPDSLRPPGMLTAKFTSRVYESSGDFSVEKTSIPFHPYKNYVGVRAPKGDVTRNMLLTDQDHVLELVTVNHLGKAVSDIELSTTLHKISWRWWWEKSAESFAGFASGRSHQPIAKEVVISKEGRAQFKFNIKYPEWGRYLLRSCDVKGGHCSSQIVYIDWPGWAGRSTAQQGAGASRLNFTSSKPEYRVGDEATVFIPQTKKGQALVSVMRADKILQQHWMELSGEARQFKFSITENMTPNIYVGISLIQPHQDKKNDTPIRLYGVIPLEVKNPATLLKPNIEVPVSIKPMQEFSIRVSETNKQSMAYTVAVVDEGLLGLTKFKSKNLHKSIYSREALRVSTWDIFDDVFGGYAAQLERLISIGGDSAGSEQESQKKRRFRPVVHFSGPHKLEGGKFGLHKVTLPNYIGAVRVMVNASHLGKYGLVEKEIKVKDDLMVLPTLPRVLGVGDQVDMPVTVFSLVDGEQTVKVAATASDGIKFAKSNSKDLYFERPGEQMATFPVYVGNHIGKSDFEFVALNDKMKSSSQVAIQVRAPNPIDVRSETVLIAAGEQRQFDIETFGIEGSNQLVFEGSQMQPLDLERHYRTLMSFPHGCAEQTMSKAFPQLVLNEFIKLNKNQSEEFKRNAQAVIKKIRGFQTSSGGIGYWEGNSRASDWITSYVLHYLLMARELGHQVPSDLLDSLVSYQRDTANTYLSSSEGSSHTQAYRLYSLALAGYPEVGAMSRLKESQRSRTATWLLALALKQSGFTEDARELVKNLSYDYTDYVEGHGTFGSSLRDIGIALMSSSEVIPERSAKIYKALSEKINKTRYINTHGISFALMGAAQFLKSTKLKKSNSESSETQFSYQIGKGDNGIVSSPTSIARMEQNLAKGKQTVTIVNPMDKPLYITRALKGVPENGRERNYAKGLALNVSYLDPASNKPVELNEMKLGQELIARVRVKNKSSQSHSNVALEYMVAAGMEILDGRLNAKEIKNLDYQDVRDDRIYSYFSFAPGESKEFQFRLQASHRGRFYMPATRVASMYNSHISSQVRGQWVVVRN